jgi:hypothetical protein
MSQEIDWEQVIRNLDRLTIEALYELNQLTSDLIIIRERKELEKR